jgi:hypothetical protein
MPHDTVSLPLVMTVKCHQDNVKLEQMTRFNMTGTVSKHGLNTLRLGSNVS